MRLHHSSMVWELSKKTELIEPGRVEVLIDVFHLVKLESCPGQVFDRVWFCPRDLGISINGDPQKRIDFGNHGALPPHLQVSQQSVFNVDAPPKKLLPLIVRHTTVAKAIGFTGKQFSKADKDKAIDLTEPNKIRRHKTFEAMSKPLRDGKDYGFFISYRWLMGRFWLHASLMVQLNHRWSAVIACVSMFVILAIAGLVNTLTDVKILPHVGGMRSYEGARWVFCAWWKTAVMVLGLFGFSQVFSRQRVFLDKLCIHQGNAHLNSSSLQHLPYILSRCQAILCVVDAEYFNRMWCVYEVAMFLKVRPGGNVIFINNWQCVMFLFILGCQTVPHVIENIIVVSQNHSIMQQFRIWPTPRPTLGILVTNAISYIFIFSQYAAMYFVGRMYFKNQRALRELQKNFDVREAKCGVPRDIPVLLQSIREQFVEERKVEGHAAGKDDGGNGDNLGDNGAGQDALDKFNASVKQLLARQIVFRGWRILPYSMVVAAYVVLAWQHALGDQCGQIRALYPKRDGKEQISHSVSILESAPDVDFYLIRSSATPDAWPWTQIWSGGMQTGFFLYMYLFYAPYKIFCFIPLLFYVQTLIVKMFYEIEECLVARLRHVSNCFISAGIPCALGILVVLAMSAWEWCHYFLWDGVAKDGVMLLLGINSVSSQIHLTAIAVLGTQTYRFQPLRNVFNCFGTGCSIDFSVRMTKGVQIVSLLLFLLSIVLVYFIHEPEFGARWRRFLWGKCVKGFHYYTICFSRGARRVSQIESKTNASNSNRFTDLV